MTTIKLIYLSIFTLAFVVGVFVYKYDKALRIFLSVMALGLLTEYAVNGINYITETRTYEPFIYNIYIPLEYFLYAFFFYCINTNKLLRKCILWSFPLFICIALFLYLFVVNDIGKLRTEVYFVSGILIAIWSISTLFLIKPLKNITFIQHPLFWISTGLVIFYVGSIPFHILFKDAEKNKILSDIIRKGLNIWLYTFVCIGFLYSHQMKRLSQKKQH